MDFCVVLIAVDGGLKLVFHVIVTPLSLEVNCINIVGDIVVDVRDIE